MIDKHDVVFNSCIFSLPVNSRAPDEIRHGGSASAVNLRPSLCQIDFLLNSGLLRSKVDKFIYSIARSSCGGALSTECSVALSTEALRWRFDVAVVVLMLSKHTALITNKPISPVSTYNGNQQQIRIKSIQENPNE